MKLSIRKIDGTKNYIARLRGLDPRYGFDREFLEGESRPLRVRKGQPSQSEYTYQLSDGLYEVCESGDRKYLAVVKNRRIPLNRCDVETAADMCKNSQFEVARVFSLWVDSRRRSSQSFAAIAVEATAAIRTRIRANLRASQKRRSRQRRERVQTMTARQAFEGSDAADTRAFLVRLEQMDDDGRLAADLFRCQKASTRAKIYRGEYRDKAYGRKADSIGKLCATLKSMHEWKWGWKMDPSQFFAPWVLYVELPQGQVSFHALERGDGPDYTREWDGQHESEARILAFCDSVLAHGRDPSCAGGLDTPSDAQPRRISAMHYANCATPPA